MIPPISSCAGESPPKYLELQYNSPSFKGRYQVGVFMSIMRVHSTLNDLPHFPFLYPKDKADAMRSALQLRYRLLPHMYSLAHVQYSHGLPIARPLFMEFPQDLSVVNTVRDARTHS